MHEIIRNKSGNHRLHSHNMTFSCSSWMYSVSTWCIYLWFGLRVQMYATLCYLIMRMELAQVSARRSARRRRNSLLPNVDDENGITRMTDQTGMGD
jgi:hypothetical protein